MRNITVLTTGGTIDKVYGRGKNVRDLTIGVPVAGSIFNNMGLANYVRFSHKSLMKKDSLDMSDKDRHAVAVACANAPTRSIIITHGTDTMIKTAEAIQNQGIGHDKLIVLTGALVPHSMKGSDAEFNLALALGVVLIESSRGIFIAMNGIHRWDECYKDETTGIFRPTRV